MNMHCGYLLEKTASPRRFKKYPQHVSWSIKNHVLQYLLLSILYLANDSFHSNHHYEFCCYIECPNKKGWLTSYLLKIPFKSHGLCFSFRILNLIYITFCNYFNHFDTCCILTFVWNCTSCHRVWNIIFIFSFKTTHSHSPIGLPGSHSSVPKAHPMSRPLVGCVVYLG